MPIDYRIDGDRKLLIATAYGALTDADLLDYAKRLLADEERHRANHELVDLRAVTGDSGITTGGIVQLAEFWRAAYDRIAGGKLALLAESDLGYGMARMYQAMRDDGPDTIAVFRGESEAFAWLADDAQGPPSG